MAKELIISSISFETLLAILEDDQVTEVFIERAKSKAILGNIYKGKVTKVLPGMQAAFVDIGLERNAFLYVSDFTEDSEEYESFLREDSSTGRVSRDSRTSPSRSGAGSTGLRRRDRRPRRDRGLSREGSNGDTPAAVQGPPQVLNETIPPRLRGPMCDGSILQDELEAIHPKHLNIRKRTAKSAPEPISVGILPDRLEPILEVSLEPSAPETPPRKPQAPPGKKTVGPTVTAVPASNPSHPPVAIATASQPASRDTSARMASTSTAVKPLIAPRDRRRRPAPSKGNVRNQIADVLKEGQEILVQISKEPIGKKGARITSHVALPGRFMVFMPTVDHIGVSRRIFSDKERQRLRRIVQEHRGPAGRGFIVRTAGENQDERSLLRDVRYLTQLWEEIRTRSEKASAPRLIHREPGLVERVIRDHFSEDFRAIRVDDENEYERIVELINRINPQMIRRVRLHNKKSPILEEFSVAEEIERALQEKVWLKNGGHIVINQTEALVAIDVNTGKFVGSTNSLEETITQANLDAVKEVVRQIRLRDLGGIIIIDFIDMDERRNRHKVMDALQDALKGDKAPSKILQFNEFGLVAITRRRVKQSLESTLCQPCILCGGSGLTRSVRTICYSIFREVRKMLPTFGEGRDLLLRCHPDVGKALRNGERAVVREIEEMARKSVIVKPDPLMHIEQFHLVER